MRAAGRLPHADGAEEAALRRAAIALLLSSIAAGAKAQTPACRLDATLAADVRQAAALALQVLAGEAVPRTFAVNPTEALPAGSVRIEIVRDASCDGTNEADEWTVAGGVCRANPSARAVRCSADALTALTALDRRAERASPALLYVIAHELAHLDQKDEARFEGDAVALNLAASEQAKALALRRLCAPAPEQLRLEEDADRAALRVLERAADLDRYRDRLLSPQAAVYTITDRLRLGAKALAEWEAQSSASAATRPVALTEQTFEPDAANVARTARRLLCQIRNGTKGVLVLPNVPGSHPDAPTRLGAISQRLRAKAKELPAGRLGLPPEMPDIQPLENLIPVMGDISAMLEQKEKEFYAALWPHLCETWLNPQEWPDCNDPETGDGTPACPLFRAVFREESIAPASAQIAHRLDGGTLQVAGRVIDAADLDGTRGLLLAVAEPPALVRWSGSAVAADALPCTPAAIVATSDGHTILCAQPFGYVRVRHGRPIELHRMTTARLNDATVTDVEGTSAAWIGGRVVGSAYLGSEGVSAGFELIPEGMRSLPAWKTAGCEKLRSGLALTELPATKEWIGTTVSRLATTEVARFDAGGTKLLRIVSPDHLQAEERGIGPALACTPTANGAICIDTDGRAFDPFGDGAPLPLPRVPFGEELRTSRVLHGSIVMDGGDLLVAAWNGSVLEVFRNTARALREEQPVVAAEWHLGAAGAHLIVSDRERSRVVRLTR